MYILDIFVTNASLNVNQTYAYYSDSFVESFVRVKVLFRNNNNIGLVVNGYEINDLEEKEKELGFKVNPIIEVIDEEPIISNEQFSLAKWLSRITISPFISCLNAMLPKALRTAKKITGPKMEKYIQLNGISESATARQKEIYSLLENDQLLSEARKLSISIIDKFIKNGVISVYIKEVSYKEETIENKHFKELTNEQKIAYNSLLNTNKLVSLLYGVTGSGKTEVYLHLARKYLSEGKEVLILVPEISLTPQMIKRVKERFNEVVFYHSELSDQERYEQYRRIENGEVKIVVGTRSAVFLPFHKLGLIIIDEEHDSSYKQDNSPCYHAKDVAIKRALTHNAKVLLASATPSLSSYTRALKGDYELLKLTKRINEQMPMVKIVDLTKEVKAKHSYIISRSLEEALEVVLNKNEQAIILLNRRGYSPIIKCGECGTTLMCDDCDSPLNYHKDENVLKCHQCGKIYKVSRFCPKCGSEELLYYGFGTKKVQEELESLFPNAHILRMDHDSVSKKGAHKKILEAFERHEADILIGTQMIAKGLDYPDVTLVGILNADAGLAHQDYNAAKMTFDLLMQASGRSGRADKSGLVIIQAFNPNHYVLKAAVSQSYDYFYKIEMNYRHKTYYPPYCHLLEIIIEDHNDQHLHNSFVFLNNEIEQLAFKHYKPLELPRIKGQRRIRFLLLHKDSAKLLDSVWSIINKYLSLKQMAKIKVDIDPLYLE